jgi:hypothetical protein
MPGRFHAGAGSVFQVAFGDLQNVVDHRFKADMLFILQAHDAGAVDRDAFTSSVPSSRRSGCSFSQPRPITITSPPKFGFSAIL